MHTLTKIIKSDMLPALGVPGATEYGARFAAALGYVAGDANKGLQSLSNVNELDNEVAKKFIDEKRTKGTGLNIAIIVIPFDSAIYMTTIIPIIIIFIEKINI